MHLNFRNINDSFKGMVELFNSDGCYESNNRIGQCKLVETQSRNGPVLMIPEPVTLTYREPRERVLFNSARDANPFFHLYEALWMLAGRNDVAPVAYYASNMKNYSDDGKTLNGAYGYRWRHAEVDRNSPFEKEHDQLQILIQHLRADPNSRRAVLQMWNVEDDLLKIGTHCVVCKGIGKIVNTYTKATVNCSECRNGLTFISKDVCCNLSVMFSLRHDAAHFGHSGCVESGKYKKEFPYCAQYNCQKHKPAYLLDMTVTNRSNDLIWGCLGANYVHFSMLQEYMAARLGVVVGKYHHFTNNLHVYKDKFEPEKWLKAHDEDVTDEVTYNRLHNLYTYSKPKLIPLVQNPEVFEKELPKFVESFSGKKTSIGNWKEPFFDTVAQPMFMAFAEYKLGLLASALQFAETIEDDAWRIAAVRWLQRRKEKRDGKKEVQIQ